MSNQLNINLPSPTKSRFAGVLRILSRISFWIQLILGIAAGITLLLVILSNNFSKTNNSYISFGIFLATISVLALAFRVYWAYQYTRLAKQLQLPDKTLHPQKAEVLDILRLGLYISLGGIVLSFLATQCTVITVLSKSLAQPQGVAVYNPRTVVRSLDLLLILADVNIIGAHFLGSINSLGLLNWLDD